MPKINGHDTKEVLSFLSGKSQKQVFIFLEDEYPKNYAADGIARACGISITGVHRVLKTLLDKNVVTKTMNNFKRKVYQLKLDKK